MQFFTERKGFDLTSQIALVLILSLLLWATNAPSFFRSAKASNVTTYSDTISDSNLAVVASSTIVFTTTSNIVPPQNNPTLSIQLDPSGSAFTEAFFTATTSQMYVSAAGTDYDVVTSCTAGNQVTAVGNYNGGANENLTLTFCTGGATIATTTTITIGVGPFWTNPSSAGSYVIRLGGTNANAGDTRVAVLNNVTVTATVDTSFTFTVTGMATTTTVNGTTTTIGTTNTLIPFGSLPITHAAIGAQHLSVATNATHGFVVTVHENQDLTDSSNDTIHLFQNGNHVAAPTAWTAPTNVLNNTQTYGHMGLTSSDAVLFPTPDTYVGDFFSTTTEAVMSDGGPSTGTTDNLSSTTVGYAIQIGSLQPAGNDYTNTLTYIATPTF